MTGLLATKLRRDLRATWSRVAMMVAAIAVSLTVFGAVLSAWSTIDRETERAYLSTEPASATILLERGVDAERMGALAAEARTLPNVIEAVGRTQFSGQVQGPDGRWRENPLQVFAAAPGDPMRIATVDVRPGAWPPAAGEILLSEDTLALLDLAVGDTVTVETPVGLQELRVAGTVYDPSLAPAAQEQTGHAYLSTASLAAAGRPALLDQLKIQVADRPGEAVASRDRDAVVAVAGQVGEWLRQDEGLAVREIQVPEPYAHPHQGQADALLGALLAGAGAALLLGVILVASMLNGLFTQQIPQIGIMKAVGARSGRIARAYLAMTLTVAAAATLLALPGGILLGRALAPNVFAFLGIQPASLDAAWWTYAVVLAAGLGLPVLLALVPLVKASRTTVRAALDHHGATTGSRAATRVLAALSRVRGLDRGLLLALRNTTRRPARFWLSAGLLAAAGTFFVAGLSTRDGTQALADRMTEQTRWDVAVQLARPAPLDEVVPVAERVAQVSRVEGWTVTPAGIAGPGRIPVSRTYPDQGHGRLAVTAVPDGTRMFDPPRLREGRWLEPGETGAVVVNQVTVANSAGSIRAGDTVELRLGGTRTSWRVAGIAEEAGASSAAYVTAAGLAEATGQPPQANTLRVATTGQDERTAQTVAAAVEEALTGAGAEVASATSAGRQEAITGGHLEPILVILLATALPMGVIGCIGLASTTGANVLERTREFGVMHAIGARPRAVRRIVTAEGVAVSLASCVLAVVPALGVTALMGTLLGNLFMFAPLPFRFSVPAAALWAVLMVLGAVLATEAAASRAARLTVREALAYL